MAGRVRQPIDVKKLERYLREHVAEIETPLDVKQFGFGQSNPTYQLTSPSGARYVLRKKPPGALVSKTAHKVEREYRIISALSSTPVPVPKAYCLCEDSAVIGTPFYVMSFLDGRIIEDPAMPDARDATERNALWRAAVETLAHLHSVDADAVGLSNFGKKSGFYARQLRTWHTICAAQAATKDIETGVAVGAIPHFDQLLAFFGDEARRPRDRGTLIHGDYKIDNLVFHPTEPRVIGILDWEMSTVGHPLSDLANLMHPFYAAEMLLKSPPKSSAQTDENRTSSTASHPGFLPNVTPGLPSPTQIMSWYGGIAGWDPAPDMTWAVSFSVFRLSAICQGIAARFATRQASSESAKKHAEAMGPLGEFAWELVCRKQGQKTAGEEQPHRSRL
ncbi:phosphotransferase enzyme family protein [Xylariaceae sp. FL0016]|nr:phosphotransferase enzyme family protein [Xylariaceae sp. FL0016]